MSLRIVLADDHTLVREALRSLLEQQGFGVVGEASDGQDAISKVRELRPDVAILDVAMPALNGVDAARKVIADAPDTKVVLLTMHAEDRYVLQALRAGVSGYVLKNRAPSELVEAIREVHRGNIYLSPVLTRTLAAAFLSKTECPTDPLSPRERQLLQLIAEGKTTREAASILGISAKTAESHRSRIQEKLNYHDTASLVRYAIRLGIIRP